MARLLDKNDDKVMLIHSTESIAKINETSGEIMAILKKHDLVYCEAVEALHQCEIELELTTKVI